MRKVRNVARLCLHISQHDQAQQRLVNHTYHGSMLLIRQERLVGPSFPGLEFPRAKQVLPAVTGRAFFANGQFTRKVQAVGGSCLDS